MNFKTVQLSYVLEAISTQVQPQDCGGAEYVGLEHLNSGDLNLGEVGQANQVRSTKWSFRAGDILYGKLRPYLNKCAVADREGICSTDILVLRPKENFLPKYIAYQLISDDFVKYSNGTASGMNLPRTTWSKFNDYEIVVPFKGDDPDLSVQKNITEKLDKVFFDTREAETKQRENSHLFKTLFTSYLYSQFNGVEIDQAELGNICDISGGFAFPLSYQGRKSEKYPFYKVSDMNAEGNEVYMKSHNNSVSEDDVKKLKLKIYPAGTIIFPKIGAAIATNKKRILTVPSTVDNNVMVLVPNKDISSRYLYNYLLNFNLSDWASKAALPSIKKSVVEKAPIPIPMNNEKPDYRAQEKFAENITTFQEQVAILEQLSRSNLESLKELRSSVLDHTLRLEKATPVLSPIQLLNPEISNLQQAIGLTLKRFPRGEMVVAKVLYLAQSIFKVPLGVSFTQQALGPYSFDIKTAIDDGLSSQKGIFVKKGTKGMEVLSLSAVGTNALNQLSGGVKKPMEDYLNVMMPLYFSSKSNSIELLATICKIIEDEKTSDDQVIYKKLQKWKPNKFGDSEIYRTISLIKKQKWDQKILQV